MTDQHSPIYDGARIIAVVVTHKRRELLAESLKVLSAQTRPIDHLIVVDNGNEPEVGELVREQPIETTYLGSEHNLGGAGGFALGILHALTMGADWVWLADDDGRPEGPEVLETLFDCAKRHGLVEVSPVVADIDEPDRLAFPLRRGLVWRRLRSELGEEDFLPGIASLFNGALVSAEAVDVIGVPDLRLFVRGDEVEVHRRLVRSGLPFGTCLQTAYLHPNGSAEFADSRWAHAHPVPGRSGEAVLHLPQSRVSDVTAGDAQAAAAGGGAVRVVLPDPAEGPGRTHGVAAVAAAGPPRTVPQADAGKIGCGRRPAAGRVMPFVVGLAVGDRSRRDGRWIHVRTTPRIVVPGRGFARIVSISTCPH